MTSTLNRYLTPVCRLLSLAIITGCSGGDPETEPEPSAFALEFVAKAGDEDVGCTDVVSGLGPDEADSVGLADLRFYVSNLKLWAADGKQVPATLGENDFQYASEAGSVSLVDLTGNDDGTCAGNAIAFSEGTARTNAAVTGTTVVEKVKAVSFDVGVPQKVMQDVIAHNSAEGAPSPLNEMQWTWASGYRHFVLNFTVEDDAGGAGEGYVHVGSGDCGPADGLALEDRDECGFVNTPQVKLEGFDLANNKVKLDVRAVLAGLDFVSPVYDFDTFEVIGEGPGVECHSSPTQPDCAKVFQSFGLGQETGSADASLNEVFGVE